MNLDDALYKSITSRGRTLDSELVDVRASLAELEAAYGGPGKAATTLGIPGRTWRRWKAGENGPSLERRGVLQRALRRVRLSKSREKFLRGKPQIGVRALVRVSSDERERNILVSGWPGTDGMMNEVLNAWLQGYDTAAAEAFERPLNAGVDGDLRLVDVHRIRFFRKRGDALNWTMRA
jgi:hypothetical protein